MSERHGVQASRSLRRSRRKFRGQLPGIREYGVLLGNGGMNKANYQETEIAPLVEEVAVYVNAVWFAQVFGYEGAYGGEVLRFEAVFIVDIAEFRRQLGSFR